MRFGHCSSRASRTSHHRKRRDAVYGRFDVEFFCIYFLQHKRAQGTLYTLYHVYLSHPLRRRRVVSATARFFFILFLSFVYKGDQSLGHSPLVVRILWSIARAVPVVHHLTSLFSPERKKKKEKKTSFQRLVLHLDFAVTSLPSRIYIHMPATAREVYAAREGFTRTRRVPPRGDSRPG